MSNGLGSDDRPAVMASGSPARHLFFIPLPILMAPMWQPLLDWLGDRKAERTSRPWHALAKRVREGIAARQGEPLVDLPVTWQQLATRWQRGADRDTILVEALELLVRATQETSQLVLHPGQILGALSLAGGALVEMQTGEGKTIVAALAACLGTFDRQSVHVATTNDYLVGRDSTLNRPLFASLGLSTGKIVQSTSVAARREAYRCDITYSTPRELAFDFLKDCLHRSRHSSTDDPLALNDHSAKLKWRQASDVQPTRHIALVDEADSLLIDEARIPFVLALEDAAAARQLRLIQWAVAFVPTLRETQDCTAEPRTGRWILSATGRELVRTRAPTGEPVPASELYRVVELVLQASRNLGRDRDYVVRNGQVVLVDEFTGRLGEGRQWPFGLHQAVEAWCGIALTPRTRPAARITAQEFFRGYARLGGITGTARDARREFEANYGCSVVTIPTHRPCQRLVWPLRALPTEGEKFREVVSETSALHLQGRPVLVGTRSIEKTEQLSELLRTAGIPHQVLHAKHLADEAQRVARAGQQGQVTLATNLAGRGTDIPLGHDVAELGGLHVIGTELHESSRIDRQLFGRCARQGDPGSCRQYVSLDDALLETAWGADRAAQIRHAARQRQSSPHHWGRLLHRAQQEVERRARLTRQALLADAVKRSRRLRRLGFDPILDLLDDD
ncbi:MAG TPA: preprotein translocase subunit SecA [Planctomycetaceae bacterium]|nr:preprotein translocase subunit SecA [Planctomycetaceae bacterium]